MIRGEPGSILSFFDLRWPFSSIMTVLTRFLHDQARWIPTFTRLKHECTTNRRGSAHIKHEPTRSMTVLTRINTMLTRRQHESCQLYTMLARMMPVDVRCQHERTRWRFHHCCPIVFTTYFIWYNTYIHINTNAIQSWCNCVKRKYFNIIFQKKR